MDNPIDSFEYHMLTANTFRIEQHGECKRRFKFQGICRSAISYGSEHERGIYSISSILISCL
jgi:hypothetical protein